MQKKAKEFKPFCQKNYLFFADICLNGVVLIISSDLFWTSKH